MRRGFAIGKFMPPHAGHAFLIDVARAHVDALTVAVCDKPGQPIPGDLRARWLREIHPDVEVVVVPDTVPDDDSPGWAAYTKAFLGYVPDVVFTSEPYGDAYAAALGCEHVRVDQARAQVPVSATAIRADPLGHWALIAPCVREYYALRVCLVGPESAGKTVLAKKLAREFGAAYVEEYGRDYTLAKQKTATPDVWRPDEFVHIAREQQRRENAAARANRIVVCDTDAFATGIWLERYLGDTARADGPSVEPAGWPARDRPIDRYLLLDPNVPFVQDGIRDGEHLREWMFARFAYVLRARDLPFDIVSGSYEERATAARAALTAALNSSRRNAGSRRSPP